MPLSLKSPIHRLVLKELIISVNKLQEHDHRIEYIEDKIAAMHTAYNEVVDLLQDQSQDLLWIKKYQTWKTGHGATISNLGGSLNLSSHRNLVLAWDGIDMH